MLEEGELTAPEVEAIEEARCQAGLNMLTLAATILSALRPEARRRLDAITARAGEVSRLATVENLGKIIIDALRHRDD